MKSAIMKEIMEQSVAEYVYVRDDSHKHEGHKGVDKVGDTHFTVRVSAHVFEGKPLVKRHQLVYKICQEFIDKGVHALAIEALTPSEWSSKYG